jgi:hypothetical protein
MKARLQAMLAGRAIRRVCILCAVLAEPVMHAAGLPHPEGLGTAAANYFATMPTET